jgi:prepilin-type N-terminal cleavage/methylation domain-containing protein
MRHQKTIGFTLIEILLVVALVGIIASFGAAMSISSFSRSVVIQERDLFVSLLLRGARSKALANIGESSHGIYIDNTCKRYILFTGETFTPPGNCNPDTRQVNFTNIDGVLSVSNSEGDTIVFEQLSGNIITGAGSDFSTVTIESETTDQEIILRTNGQIDW